MLAAEVVRVISYRDCASFDPGDLGIRQVVGDPIGCARILFNRIEVGLQLGFLESEHYLLALLLPDARLVLCIGSGSNSPDDGLDQFEWVKRCLVTSPTDQLLVPVLTIAPSGEYLSHLRGGSHKDSRLLCGSHVTISRGSGEPKHALVGGNQMGEWALRKGSDSHLGPRCSGLWMLM